MITNYKRKDLQKVIDGDSELYNVFSLVADQLRTIYVTLGWSHMTDKYQKANELVDEMTVSSLKSLQSGDEDSNILCAGLSVRAFFDSEDFLNIDYGFHII